MPAICDVDADNVLLRLLLTPEGRADPYPHYRQLRDTALVLRSSFGPIVLSRYDDCMTALRDPPPGRGTALRAAGGAPLGFAGFDAAPAVRKPFFERATTKHQTGRAPVGGRVRQTA